MMEIILMSKSIAPLETMECAARTSYKSKKSDNPAIFLDKLLRAGHMSVFEFCWFCFKIIDITRDCADQLRTHRLFSFIMSSTRHVNQHSISSEIDDPTVLEECNGVVERYNNLMLSGVRRENARYVLPLGISTDLSMAGNLRMWMEFFPKRTVMQASPEIRKVAKGIFDIIKKEATPLLDEYDVESLAKLNP